MQEAAQAIPPDHALGRSVEELAQELCERFRIEPLDVAWDAMTLSHKDERVDVSGDWMRGPFDGGQPVYVPGTSLSYHIPFKGESDLFKMQPSHLNLNPPRARIRGSEVVISVTAPAPIQDSVKNELDRQLQGVRTYVDWVNSDVLGFNNRLVDLCRQAAEARRAKVLADLDLVASFGIPVRRREDAATTYVAPAVRRKPTPASPTKTGPASPPEPILSAEEYEHILSVVRNMAVVLERSPKAFAGMDEEALRQHFLVQLNGQYEGNATGETFNFEGKTDILIRERNRNLFIAECKFWDGPKHLSDTVDQILRYSSWRDTKTAILIFNRGRALTHLLGRISETVTAHPNFVREIAYGSETEFRFVLHHNQDDARELTLTILVFEVPA